MHLKKYIRYMAVAALAMLPLIAAQFGGQVKFVGPPKPPATAGEAPGAPVVLPLPGATVTATQADKTLTAVSDEQGNFTFADLPDGTWNLKVDMVGFSPVTQEVTTGTGLPGPVFQMKMLSLDQIEAAVAPPAPVSAAAPATTTNAAPGSSTPTPAPTPATPSIAANGKGKAPAAPAATAFQRTNLNSSGGGAAAPAEPPAPEVTNELNQRAADGLLVNGSSQNGASTPFAQNPAFGNNRKGGPRFYTYSVVVNESNSALNAANYNLTGQPTVKPPTNTLTGGFNWGGPIVIPHLIARTRQVQFTINYSRTDNRNSSVSQPGLMPTTAERAGDFSQVANHLTGQPVQIFDPTNDQPFANNVIPTSRISPQALSLLKYYLQPNFSGSTTDNYQVPLISNNHTDSFSARVSKNFKRKNFISGNYGMQDTRSDSDSVFNFLDLTRQLGQQVTGSYRRTFTPRFYGTFTYQFSRQSTQNYPFFSGKTDVEGQAGITGVNESPLYWGPPQLGFSSGTFGLGDGQASIRHNQVSSYGYLGTWNHGRHNIQFGGDYKWQQFNTISQSTPRGQFSFNGAATQQTTSVNGVSSLVPNTGYDFADFLLGVPDTSSIAYGNADKYLRAKVADLYVTDDWKVSPGLSLTLAVRWEYTSPITEKYGRLVNLDISPGFAAAAPVCATNLDGCATVGPLTGASYPASLVHPDKHEFRPLPGLAWRPFPASSMVVRAGYGIAYNTNVYNAFANSMAVQSPLSKSLNLQNTAATPLTLANGFTTPPNISTNSIAVDPNFKIGYAQVWNASIQRDLPGSLVMLATYTGTKGTHLLQEFVPNTYPIGAVNPCPTCPNNFDYFTSNANLTRQAGTMNLRRRLHNGFTAQVIYTYAKSIDDAALVGNGGGGQPAQNWRNLTGERGLSSNDQRHNGQIQLQYTSGMGMGGGTLLSGWRGKLIKDWTFVDNINLGTGLPLTPTYPENLSPVLGSVRASYTGADIYNAPSGHVLNPLAVSAPVSGQFGNAGIGSITGPAQFSMNASMQRSFRLNDRFTLSLQINANNPINHVIATAWGTSIANSTFGTVVGVNPMRSVTTVMRLTF